MIFALIFAIANGYFAYQAYQRKDWLWFTISGALAAFCAWQLLP